MTICLAFTEPSSPGGGPRLIEYKGDRSALLFGPSGRGKYTDTIAHTIARHRGHLYVLDTKAEAAVTTWEARSRMGPVYVINPWRMFTHLLPRAARYNAAREAVASGKGADWITSSIILSDGGAAHFTDGAAVTGTGVIDFAVHRYGDAIDLNVIAELFNLPEILPASIPGETHMDLMSEMFTCGIKSARHAAAPYLAKEVSRANRDIWDTLRIQFGRLLMAPGVQECFSGFGDFLFADMKKPGPPITVYFCIPEAQLKKHRRVTRLLLEAFFEAQLTEPRVPCLAILDELGNTLGKTAGHYQDGDPVDRVSTGISMGRSYGLQIQAVFQDVGQAEQVFGKENFLSLMASCGVWQFMKPNDPKSAKLISELSGVREVISVTRSMQSGLSDNGTGKPSQSNGTTVNYQVQQLPLIRMHDLKTMHPKEQVIFADNSPGPIRAWGFPYYHPRSGIAHLFAPNPYAPGYVAPALPAPVESAELPPATAEPVAAPAPAPRKALPFKYHLNVPGVPDHLPEDDDEGADDE